VVPVFLIETATDAPFAAGATTAKSMASGTTNSRPRMRVT
jgi:hypothetical protein